jgi:hypothetical protein
MNGRRFLCRSQSDRRTKGDCHYRPQNGSEAEGIAIAAPGLVPPAGISHFGPPNFRALVFLEYPKCSVLVRFASLVVS